MTGGGAFFPPSGPEDFELDEMGQPSSPGGHAVQWVGKPGVKGPGWARLPLLTVGMLGIQCVWSIEMGYASPYLLDLGLSKSYMSLVFMAGPLSGLIVQPLVGAFADRSQSRFGRRRPFMVAGCAICVFAMMLLGWTREVAGLFGMGNWMAIFLAVWAIYLIDFSINAVMSTDRALIVDTLPPKEQEEGSAWAGRMNGFGGLAGFFVGNLDLPPILPFLGKTQLQILSFITSAILMGAHFFTAWGVTERVLLRDDRAHNNSLWSNLKSIWDNLFSLPPGIKTICLIQFFASLGWYPVLFFTTIWVTEVYKQAHPELDPLDPDVGSAAVRAGARSLFCQSVVNIICAVSIPFLVGSSGVIPPDSEGYTSLNGHGGTPGSATWKRTIQERQGQSRFQRAIGWTRDFIDNVRSGQGVLPLKGLTLMRVWVIAQVWFAIAMTMTWFVKNEFAAYVVIGSTGFSWAIYQWAPFCLLGELILLESGVDRSGARPRLNRASIDLDEYDPHDSPSPLPVPVLSHVASSARSTPLQTHPGSGSGTSTPRERKSRPGSLELTRTASGTLRGGDGLTPLLDQTPRQPDRLEAMEHSIVIHHSDSEDDEDDDEDDLDHLEGDPSGLDNPSGSGSSRVRSGGYRPNSPRSPLKSNTGDDIGDKAGVILGIHNVYLVCPQFIVTFLSSLIFAVMEPSKELPGHHPQANPVLGINATSVEGLSEFGDMDGSGDLAYRGLGVGGAGVGMVRREDAIGTDVSSPDAVGLIFRIGGVSAAIGAFICWRLMKKFAKGEGI